MSEKGLRIENLSVTLKTRGGDLKPVDGVSLDIPQGRIVGLVGESGCGKSMTAKSIMGLLPPGGKVSGGRILLDGEEISTYTPKQMRAINGDRISMVFQEPMTSLNPVVRVGKQIEESLILHKDLPSKERKEAVLDIMRKVGIPEVEKRYYSYPFELSGGLRQRVVIAMAMICNPELLIADEPTTALDVTIEAQILKLMENLRSSFQASILLITHNLGVVARTCDTVNVMYMGQIVESCDKVSLFEKPMHPYTMGLLRSLPRIDSRERLTNIKGMVPTLDKVPEGCRFANRCPYAEDACRKQEPCLEEAEAGHFVRCRRQYA